PDTDCRSCLVDGRGGGALPRHSVVTSVQERLVQHGRREMYIASKEISAILGLAAARAERGQATSLFAEGPPGSGKTALAEERAARIGGRVIYYSCAPDRERDLLYAVDVDGVLRRERGWLP